MRHTRHSREEWYHANETHAEQAARKTFDARCVGFGLGDWLVGCCHSGHLLSPYTGDAPLRCLRVCAAYEHEWTFRRAFDTREFSRHELRNECHTERNASAYTEPYSVVHTIMTQYANGYRYHIYLYESDMTSIILLEYFHTNIAPYEQIYISQFVCLKGHMYFAWTPVKYLLYCALL